MKTKGWEGANKWALFTASGWIMKDADQRGQVEGILKAPEAHETYYNNSTHTVLSKLFVFRINTGLHTQVVTHPAKSPSNYMSLTCSSVVIRNPYSEEYSVISVITAYVTTFLWYFEFCRHLWQAIVITGSSDATMDNVYLNMSFVMVGVNVMMEVITTDNKLNSNKFQVFKFNKL